MTEAFDVFGPTPNEIRTKANWLGRYLAVEGHYDKKLKPALLQTVSDIDKSFGELNDDTKSGRVRRVQLGLAHKEIRNHIDNLFGSVGNLIRDNRQDAAVAAVNAQLYDERGLLARIFKRSSDRKQYADSLTETARRNVEATTMRVLKTEIPLSHRVWKTRALAKGQVQQAINNGLAKGDSAANIAKNVKALVNPDSPGGISYAAKRLGRTEINNAFHAQSIADSQNVPWCHDMEWHLSKVHKIDPGDECETYALQKTFDTEHVPDKPHPNCRCYVTPYLLSYDEFEQNLLAGQYNSYLDSVMGKNFSQSIPGPTSIEISEPKVVYAQGTPITPNILINDISSASSVEGLKFWLQKEYPYLKFVNFDSDHSTLEAAQQITQAIHDLLKDFPESSLRQVVFGDGPMEEYARTLFMPDGTSIVKFNDYWLRFPEEFKAQWVLDEAKHFHVPNTSENPYYSITIHEFGHVVDNDGGQNARDAVLDLLSDLYKESNTELDYSTWLKKNLISRYSMEESHWDASPAESLAEAFVDVKINGEEAQPLSKELYKLLIDTPISSPTVPSYVSDLIPKYVGREAKWTGPEVAAPTKTIVEEKWGSYGTGGKRKVINVGEDTDKYWEGLGFDYRKDFYRQGSREVQVKGYKGFSLSKDYEGHFIQVLDQHEGSATFGQMITIPDEALSREFGKEIVARAVEADPTTTYLYRGFPTTQDNIDALSFVGQRFSLPLSSFTSDPRLAYDYANQEFWVSQSVPEGAKPFVIQLESGAKVATVSHGGEAESIAFGKFEVVDVIEEHYAPIPTFRLGALPPGSKEFIPKTIVVRQYSMKEALHLDRSIASNMRGVIPEFTIIDEPPVSIAQEAIRRTVVGGLDLSKASLEEVKNYIEGHLEIPTFGFNSSVSPISTESAREIAISLTEMKEKYPDVALQFIGVKPIDESTYAQTVLMDEWSNESAIFFDSNWVSNLKKFKESMKNDVERYHHSLGADDNPVRSTMFHEFLHAMQNTMGEEYRIQPEEVEETLMDHWKSSETKLTLAKWLAEQLSGYSFTNENITNLAGINTNEALAESFDEVERLGDRASVGSKALHDLIIHHFNLYLRKVLLKK